MILYNTFILIYVYSIYIRLNLHKKVFKDFKINLLNNV